MARKIYLRGGIGVGGFRRIYGGNQRNGSRPRHFCKSSGSVARHILQQLQTMNIIDFDPKGYVFFSQLNCIFLVFWWCCRHVFLLVRKNSTDLVSQYYMSFL